MIRVGAVVMALLTCSAASAETTDELAPPLNCADETLVPFSDARNPAWSQDDSILRAACAGTHCVSACSAKDVEADDQAPYRLWNKVTGSFRCAGKLEKIVTMMPCS